MLSIDFDDFWMANQHTGFQYCNTMYSHTCWMLKLLRHSWLL